MSAGSVFIEVSVDMCMNIYVFTVFLKKKKYQLKVRNSLFLAKTL
jgi:hypothetical protein